MTGAYKIPVYSTKRYCRLCHASIFFVETGRRRKLPVDPDGRGHVCLIGKIRVNWGEKA